MLPFYYVIPIYLILFQKIKSVFGANNELSTFGYCLQQQQNPSQGFVSCLGRQALQTLQTIEESDNYTLFDGVEIRNENQISRSLPSFLNHQDPMDFRGMLENAGAIVNQRTLQWDMSRIHPGLKLKIGPHEGQSSVLEFVMDSEHDLDDRTYIQEPSTARILTKSFIVPFLLGLKFNMITLLPLVIAALIFISKKAVFLGKIALFLTGLFGAGGALSLASLGGGIGGGGGFNHHYPHRPYGFGDGIHHDTFSNGYYKTENLASQTTENIPQQIVDNFYDYEKKILLRDRSSKLYERELDGGDDRIDKTEKNNGYRNFAWKTTK